MLHKAASEYNAPPRAAKTLVTSFSILGSDDPWVGLERYIAARPNLSAYLEDRQWREPAQNLFTLHFDQLRHWAPDLGSLWTHNDLHASNLFWTSNEETAEVSAIIDFGLSDRTNTVHDIATAIERNGVRWLSLEGTFEQVVHLDQIDALLNGYEQIRPLRANERQALVTMLPLVHLEFALSETDYYLAILKSEERASIAWDGYCLGHVAWFSTCLGQKLLDHLKAWADTENRRSQVEQGHDVCH